MIQKETAGDEKFISALSDVVWRFHVYGQYGGKQEKAIKTLARRAPGYSTAFYEEMFALDFKLLKATIDAAEEATKSTKTGQKYSQLEDVDSKFVMNKLHSKFPEQPDDFLNRYRGMVIYWYYLR